MEIIRKTWLENPNFSVQAKETCLKVGFNEKGEEVVPPETLLKKEEEESSAKKPPGLEDAEDGDAVDNKVHQFIDNIEHEIAHKVPLTTLNTKKKTGDENAPAANFYLAIGANEEFVVCMGVCMYYYRLAHHMRAYTFHDYISKILGCY